MKKRIGFALLAVTAFLVVPGAGATTPGVNGLLAFSSQQPACCTADIWTIKPDGTGQETRLTNDASADDPAWSPDGRKIAYVKDFGNDASIWSMNADGSNQRQLTSGSLDRSPAWSPDGSKIAFASTRPSAGSGFTAHVWVMNSDGSNLQQLTTDATTVNAGGYNPDWSPDGTRIVFDDGRDIYVMNANGSNVTRLTTDPGRDWNPSFSPDGQEIVFVSDRGDGYGSIYVMNADGSNQTQLTNFYLDDLDPVWSPDGTKIAFAREGFSNQFEIWTMNPDGSDLTSTIPPSQYANESDRYPSWQSAPPPLPACQVPKLNGKTVTAAKRAIGRAHCRVGRITLAVSKVIGKGRVISQRPRSGTRLKPGARINLVVSKGRRP